MTLFPSLLRNQNLCSWLARYPECLLCHAASERAGGRHPRPRSPPAPVEQVLVGTEGGVFSVSCVWGLEGWGVGVGTSADPRRDVQALAGVVVCLAVVIVRKECASGVWALGCTLYGVPADSSGAPPSAGECISGMVASHVASTAVVAACVQHGHQRDVPAYSMHQLFAVVVCRAFMRWHNAGYI